MATLEDALVSYLTGYADIKAIISTRVYLHNKPQTHVYPCLVIKRVLSPRVLTHDTSGSGTLAYPRIRFEFEADQESTVKTLADHLRAALNGKRGSIGTSPNSTTIQAALIQDEATEYDEAIIKYRSRSEYTIWHQE